MSDISIWASVDPVAEKAPGWTPYRYCFQNPIKLIDPDGRFEGSPDEWDVNIQTGETKWKSDKGGENTQYINFVDNNGNKVSDVVVSGLNKSNVPANVSYLTNYVMGKLGYVKRPIQATVYSKETTAFLPNMPRGKGGTYTYGTQIQINEKYAYFPENYVEVSRSEIESPMYKPGLLNLSRERVARNQIVYSSNFLLISTKEIVNFFNSTNGNIKDMTEREYPGWNAYPNNIILINNYRKIYGTH